MRSCLLRGRPCCEIRPTHRPGGSCISFLLGGAYHWKRLHSGCVRNSSERSRSDICRRAGGVGVRIFVPAGLRMEVYGAGRRKTAIRCGVARIQLSCAHGPRRFSQGSDGDRTRRCQVEFVSICHYYTNPATPENISQWGIFGETA